MLLFRILQKNPWTDTCDVFKQSSSPVKVSSTSLEPTHVMYLNIGIYVFNKRHGTWTDTCDVFKQSWNKYTSISFRSWTDTCDVFKLQKLAQIVGIDILEPTHVMYLNRIVFIFVDTVSPWTDTCDVFKHGLDPNKAIISLTWTDTCDVFKRRCNYKAVCFCTALNRPHVMYLNLFIWWYLIASCCFYSRLAAYLDIVVL